MLEQIREAITAGPRPVDDHGVLTGYSGGKLIGALQRLTGLWRDCPDACYLEIGVFRGLSLLSVAAANPDVPCYGIDNFAFFDRDGQNLSLVRERQAALGAHNAHLINEDYENALEALGRHLGSRRVAVYFIDGPHDYRSQLMCLQLALPFLHDEAVILVDDSNYRDVRQANRDFLVTHPQFALLFEAYTPCHPANMTPEQLAAARDGWWNGVNVLVRDAAGSVERSVPETERDRKLFEDDRITHSAAVARFAPRAMRLTQLLDEGRLLRWLRESHWLLDDLRASRAERTGLFPETNTYSAHLPSNRFAELRALPSEADVDRSGA